MSGSLRVLMAEDEVLAAEVLAEGLSEAGFTVLTAPDGQAALELAAAGAAFDLLLTDLRMPRMDGRELIARLRSERPDLPVVVMTGFPPPDGPAALHSGPAPLRLLTKPIQIAPLVDALRSVAGLA
ncbi:response regulator [Roseicella sp. DB1501]|uniref:response regulator n=1 Tax=Roseicella sp. DB1501 TaxID=2730925 RepID=UPI0020C540B8|nr:response regulator [Roseicella sp. DB1501]